MCSPLSVDTTTSEKGEFARSSHARRRLLTPGAKGERGARRERQVAWQSQLPRKFRGRTLVGMRSEHWTFGKASPPPSITS